MIEHVHRWRISSPTLGYYVGAVCKKEGCGAIKVLPADSDTRSGWILNRRRQTKQAERTEK